MVNEIRVEGREGNKINGRIYTPVKNATYYDKNLSNLIPLERFIGKNLNFVPKMPFLAQTQHPHS